MGSSIMIVCNVMILLFVVILSIFQVDGQHGGSGMGGGSDECCPFKKIWGSRNPMMDGMYMNTGKKPMSQLPGRCNSPCIYIKKGAMDGMEYCFADSLYSQSMCDTMGGLSTTTDMGSSGGTDDGELPVDMGSTSMPDDGETPVDMGSTGSPGDGQTPIDMGSTDVPDATESPVDMGSTDGPDDGEKPVDMGSTDGPDDGEKPVDLGSTSDGEKPINMGSTQGSGETPMDMTSENPVSMGDTETTEGIGGTEGKPSSGRSCGEKMIMNKCNVDCQGVEPNPEDGSEFASSCNTINNLKKCTTSWTVLSGEAGASIWLKCPKDGAELVKYDITCQDNGEWEISPSILKACQGSASSTGMGSPGNKETTMGMGDHGGKETTKGGKETTKGMEDHGGQETTKGMSDHSGDMGMGDHGGKETTKKMPDHSGDMGMGDHGGKETTKGM